MDCDRADLVIGLLEGELDPAEKAEVEAHLQGCGACRETRDAYAATMSDLRALPAERPSPEAAARAYAAVVEAMSAAGPVGTPVAPAQGAGKVLAFPAPRAQGRRALVVQLAAAAACLLLVVALVAPQREARTAASAPAAPATPAADALAQSAPAAAKAIAEPAKPRQGSLAAVEQIVAESEADDAQSLSLRRRAEEAERARVERERRRDAAAGEGRAAGARFLDALQLFTRLVNIGDAKSLATHPASTTHRQLSADELAKSGVTEDAVRLCVGIEHIDDLRADLDQALAAV